VTPREAQKQLTRARLVEAGVAAFRSQGYAATTVEDIAAAAGVTRATFYLHFDGKLDLYREYGHGENGVAPAIEELHDRLPVVAGSGDRPVIRQWLDDSFRLWERLKVFATIQEQVAAIHPEVRDSMTAHFNDAVGAMAGGLAESRRWDLAECRVRAMLAYAQLQNVFRHWRMAGWGDDRERALEVMTDMWVAALVGTKPSNGTARRGNVGTVVGRTRAGARVR
jgi:AcrR family transcriptional regulator